MVSIIKYKKFGEHAYDKYTVRVHTVKPVLRGHLWYKEKVAL